MTVHQRQAKIARALAHPMRLRILEVLRAGEECVCHLKTVLGLPQPYVSQQLAVLRQAGLVTARKDGLNIYYRLSSAAVVPLLDALGNLVRQQASQRGEKLLWPAPADRERLAACVCPKCRAQRI